MFVYEKPMVEVITVEMADVVCASVGQDEEGGGRIF